MQFCFKKYLQPQWAKWKEKKADNYDDESNTKFEYFRFVYDVLANKTTGIDKESSLTQKCLTSLTKTSTEVFHPYGEYEPPTIKYCHSALIWLVTNRIIGSNWSIQRIQQLTFTSKTTCKTD